MDLCLFVEIRLVVMAFLQQCYHIEIMASGASTGIDGTSTVRGTTPGGVGGSTLKPRDLYGVLTVNHSQGVHQD